MYGTGCMVTYHGFLLTDRHKVLQGLVKVQCPAFDMFATAIAAPLLPQGTVGAWLVCRWHGE